MLYKDRLKLRNAGEYSVEEYISVLYKFLRIINAIQAVAIRIKMTGDYTLIWKEMTSWIYHESSEFGFQNKLKKCNPPLQRIE